VKLYHRDDNETDYIPLSEVEETVFKGVDSCDVGIVWNQVGPRNGNKPTRPSFEERRGLGGRSCATHVSLKTAH